MLGKSGRALPVCVAFACFLLAACAATVSQDAKTGADGKQKGAKEMKFENGEANSKGIVTYPGGDRVDWLVFETPDKKTGDVALKLSWTPPRPGLQLAFDVFDEWNTQVASSSKTTKKKGKKLRSKGKSHEANVPNIHGKYFVRVYAVGRGDAGTYHLTAEFTPAAEAQPYDPSKLDVNDPPRLADIPAVEVGCDEFTFDVKNPACKPICPQTGAPKDWPACKGKCPDPPDINNPKCWDTMPCPNPPDRKVKSCKFPACPDPKHPDPNNPNCDNATVDPVVARILKNEVSSDGVLITIGAGSASGIGKDWSGTVLRGDSGQPLSGGQIKVVRLDKNIVVGLVHMTPDQIAQNTTVRMSPPPRSH